MGIGVSTNSDNTNSGNNSNNKLNDKVKCMACSTKLPSCDKPSQVRQDNINGYDVDKFYDGTYYRVDGHQDYFCKPCFMDRYGPRSKAEPPHIADVKCSVCDIDLPDCDSFKDICHDKVCGQNVYSFVHGEYYVIDGQDNFVCHDCFMKAYGSSEDKDEDKPAAEKKPAKLPAKKPAKLKSEPKDDGNGSA